MRLRSPVGSQPIPVITFAETCGDEAAPEYTGAFLDSGQVDTAPLPAKWHRQGNWRGFLPPAAAAELAATAATGQGNAILASSMPSAVAPHPLTFVFLLGVAWAIFRR